MSTDEDRQPATPRSVLGGVAILVAGAVVAWLLGVLLPWPDPLLLAVAFGAVLANAVGLPAWIDPGLGTHKIWLGAGIVLMGASVPVQSLVAGGPVVLVLVLGVVVVTTLLVEGLARNVFGIRERLGSLLAVGTGICGVSAVVAVAGSIKAREETIAYAAGTVLLFDAVTLATYPTVGSLLGVPDQVFGIWTGLSMFSTGPVVATGFAHSEVAGQWATITKLARNALIGGVVLAYAGYYARRGAETSASVGLIWTQFPKFVLGFLAFVAVASLGLLSSDQVTALEHTYEWLFLVAFVGLGTELKGDVFSEAGLKPILAVLVTWLLVAVTTLGGLWLVIG